MAVGKTTSIKIYSMKKVSWIMLTVITIVSCNNYKNIIENQKLCEFDNIVTEEEIFFDKKKYPKEMDTILNNETILSRYYTYPDGNDITNKQANKYREMVMVFSFGKVKKSSIFILRWFNRSRQRNSL